MTSENLDSGENGDSPEYPRLCALGDGCNDHFLFTAWCLPWLRRRRYGPDEGVTRVSDQMRNGIELIPTTNGWYVTGVHSIVHSLRTTFRILRQYDQAEGSRLINASHESSGEHHDRNVTFILGLRKRPKHAYNATREHISTGMCKRHGVA